MRITDFTPGEKPRERLVAEGPRALSDAELLAILLRVGVHGTNVIDTARLLLSSADNSLSNLCRMGPHRMCSIPGIGMSKAVTIVAAMELARRAGLETKRNRTIDTPEDATALLRSLFSNDSKEECWCIFLKKSRSVICTARISEGGESETELDIKQIVRRAIDVQARCVIVSHNHPSGDCMPSKSDIILTEKLRNALSTFEIFLMDHLILSEYGTYSFSEDKHID